MHEEILGQYEERKQTKFSIRFYYKATYLRCLELQARILAKCIQGELENMSRLWFGETFL